MRLRTKYILFIVILHLVALVLSFFIFRQNTFLFLIAEVLILFSVFISWRLYSELIRPLQLLMQGADAIRDMDFNVKFLATGKYEMDQLIRVYNGMIDQLRLERVKQEQQHFFLEKLIYTSPTGILILDYEDKIQQINPKALLFLALEEKQIKGKSVHEFKHPFLQQIAMLGPGGSRMFSVNGVNTYKIQQSHFIDRGFPRHFIMIEELTVEILAAEKKAYGKVIRMMAHEVNNTIGAVNSILQSTHGTETLWREGDQSLRQTIQVAIDRNQNLNLFMRNFAEVVKLPEPDRKKISLRKVLQAVIRLMEPKAASKNIHFEFVADGSGFDILADELQMEQVLVNIVKNAIEAIGENGRIRLSMDPAKKQLIIEDSGMGIPADVSEQLFSPFFSTKKDGQGIGLTIVREILLNHGFSFSLKTIEPGRTEFIIQC